MIFARKMPEFYIIITRKIFSRFLEGRGGNVPSLPPVSNAYEYLRGCMGLPLRKTGRRVRG